MKKILLISAVLLFCLPSFAQTNAPVKLALVSETASTASAVDLLTAKFSGDGKIQLLERDQIEKVYREQSLSAANTDFLKLGQILGADGLLLLNVVHIGNATNLTARLIAVKPGVILADSRFDWPLKNPEDWPDFVATYFNSFLPKLNVSRDEAIPISVVNLRSAINSQDEAETERALKLLTIQRLSQERQFFVLERQKMQLLGEEKNLSADDSAFWDGSYLLDGVIDQNGYSPDTVTINAHLTPPKGGAPVLIKVSGSRTNLSEVVNQLAAKVNAALKINSNVPAWNAADEAAKFFEEAKWALRWGIYSEAQAAAESAWALGKHDEACAIIRIRAYANGVGKIIIGFGGYDRSFIDSVSKSDRDYIIKYIYKDSNDYAGMQFAFGSKRDICPITTATIYNSPTPESLDWAIRALELYREFNPAWLLNEAKTNSAWGDFGIENLTMAAGVLRHFYLAPKAQTGAADKLAELRALSRSVAESVSQLPLTRDSYVSCEMTWGCFWQETPEDCVALYRNFLNNPALSRSTFSQFQKEFCSRSLEQPRLTAWHDSDRKRIPAIWSDFIRELDDSTNQFLQAEAKVFKRLSPAGLNASEAAAKFPEFWRETAETDSRRRTVQPNTSNDADQNQPEKILAEIEQKQQQQLKYQKRRMLFQQKKDDLQSQTNFDFMWFANTLLHYDYKIDEAKELLPLLTNYETRIVRGSEAAALDAIAQKKNGSRQTMAKKWIHLLENKLKGIISPPAHSSALAGSPKDHGIQSRSVHNSTQTSNSLHGIIASNFSSTSIKTAPTNCVLVKQYFPIPQESLLINGYVPEIITNDLDHGICCVMTRNHFVREGKLVLDVSYGGSFVAPSGYSYDVVKLGAALTFYPNNKSWKTIHYPRDFMIRQFEANSLYEIGSVAVDKGYLYIVEDGQAVADDNQPKHQGQIQRYDFKTGQWETLGIHFQTIPDLTTVNGRLFAVGPESISEISDDGRSTFLLASTRRKPAASILDSLDSLGEPTLFSGPDDSLRVNVGNKIYSWNGKDWSELFDFGFTPRVGVFEGAVLFSRARGFQPYRLADESLWVLQKNQTVPELCLYQKALRHISQSGSPKPFWKLPDDSKLLESSPTFFRSNIYFLVDHATVTNVSGHWLAKEKDGYQAQLICLSRDCSEPIVIPMKFDSANGRPPLAILAEKMNPSADAEPAWLSFIGDTLYVGQNLTPDVWAIQISEIESAIAAQKQILLAQQSQAKTAAEQAQKNFFARFDPNHNGIIDLDERKKALDNLAFITAQLDLIDANHNGQLDLDELAYFDANQNKKLDVNEETGIQIAVHLLTVQALQTFDANRDGTLDSLEFQSFAQSFNANTFGQIFNSPEFDVNRDGKIDSTELEVCLWQILIQKFHFQRPGQTIFVGSLKSSAQRLSNLRDTFEIELARYWRKSGGGTKRPSFNAIP